MLARSASGDHRRLSLLRSLRFVVVGGIVLSAPGLPVRAQELSVRPQANSDSARVALGGYVDVPVLANDALGLGPSDPAPRLNIIVPPRCGRVDPSPSDARQLRYTDGAPGSAECAAPTRTFVYEVQLPRRREGPMALVTITVGDRPPPAPPPVKPPDIPPDKPPVPKTVEPPKPPPPPPGPVGTACDVRGASFKMIRTAGGRVDRAAVPPDLRRYARWLDDEVRTVGPACIMVLPVTYGEMRKFVENLRPEERDRLLAAQLEPISDGSSGKPMDQQIAGGVSHPLAVAYAESLTARLGRTFALPNLSEYAGAALEANQSRNDPQAQMFGADVARNRIEWTSSTCPSGETAYWSVGTGQNEMLDRFCFSTETVEPSFSLRLIIRLQ